MKIDDAVKGIVAYRKLIHEENYWNNPERLSDVMAKLAVYNAYLADNIAGLHKTASEKQITAFRSARLLEVGVTEAEKIAKQESLDDREVYEKIKYVYTSTGNLITVLQSRLRVIEQQRKDEGI